MDKNLSQEDIKNILILISKASISGAEATPVAILQQKLTALLTPEPAKEDKPKE